MIIFKTPVILLALAVLIGLHIASLLVSEKLGKMLTYVNIGLHILLLPLLLIQKFTIEEGVLVYMISIFAYTLASYIVYKVSGGKGTPSTASGPPPSEMEANGTPSTAMRSPSLEREANGTPSTAGGPPPSEMEANGTPSTASGPPSPEEKALDTAGGSSPSEMEANEGGTDK